MRGLARWILSLKLCERFYLEQQETESIPSARNRFYTDRRMYSWQQAPLLLVRKVRLGTPWPIRILLTKSAKMLYSILICDVSALVGTPTSLQA